MPEDLRKNMARNNVFKSPDTNNQESTVLPETSCAGWENIKTAKEWQDDRLRE